MRTRNPRFRLIEGAIVIVAVALVSSTVDPGTAAQSNGRADVRPETKVERLQELSRKFAAELEAKRPPLYYDLLRQSTAGAPGESHGRLMYIASDGMPIYFTTHNEDAAATISTDDVWPGGAAGFSLNGDRGGLNSTYMAVWDSGSVHFAHDELFGRVRVADPVVTSDHATHVAGTMIAKGVVASAKGMSPAASLVSYDWDNDESEMALAASVGLNVSNHSYGKIRGWSGNRWYGNRSISSDEDYRFGFYTSEAQNWDEIAHDAPYYTIVKSAGNDRNDKPPSGAHWDWNGSEWVPALDTHPDDGGVDGGYDTLGSKSCAKNIITVGAVASLASGWTSPSDVVMSSFSGWGPTDDGRIKPDLVADGVRLYSSRNAGVSSYTDKTGTSMAAPGVSGSINLMVQHYENTHSGEIPLASTIKALLVHAAHEAGPNDGPDYQHGWGLANIEKAIQIIDADQLLSKYIIESTLNEGEVHTYLIHADGKSTRSATLAWTDPPGTPPSASLDPTTRMLVNDLDVRVDREDGFTPTNMPWILDPANPSAAATRGDNVLDNVEKVEFTEGRDRNYVVTVSHKGSLSGGSQTYSLILSHALSTCFGSMDPVRFTPSNAVVQSGGASWIDVDGNGRPDVFATQSGDENQLFQNLGGGIFGKARVETLAEMGAASAGAAWCDFDNDGLLDVYMANADGVDRLYRNAGNLEFVPVTLPGATASARSAAWSDFDGDGDADVYVCNFDAPNVLYRNDGNGVFVDARIAVLSDPNASNAAAWCDYDGDSDPDLVVTNANAPNRLFRNEGNGVFVEVLDWPRDASQQSWGVAWGDADNDGDFDLVVANDPGTSRLLRNVGNGRLEDWSEWSWTRPSGRSVDWVDIENDGDLDLFVADTQGASAVLVNTGTGFDHDPAGELGVSAEAAAWGDWEGDGDVDAFIVDPIDGASGVFLNSLCSDHRWLQVDLVGKLSNRSAVGARVVLTTTDGVQIREVTAGSGYQSQSSFTLAFGLGEATSVTSLQVLWPSGGQTQLDGLDADQRLVVEEEAATAGAPAARGRASIVTSTRETSSTLRLSAGPNPFTLETGIRFRLAQPAPVQLRVYSVDGRLVRVLGQGEFPAGEHWIQWDGRNRAGGAASAGVYFVRLQTPAETLTRRVIRLE